MSTAAELQQRHAKFPGDVSAASILVEVLADGDGRRRTGGDQVGQVGVAELGEGVVADVQRPFGQPALARNGEVPRQVEVVAGDAGVGEGG